MNTGVQVSIQVFVSDSFEHISEVELLDCTVQLSEELLFCLPQWLHHLTFPPARHKVLISLYLHQHLLFSVCMCVLNSSYLNGYELCELIFHSGFGLHFPNG